MCKCSIAQIEQLERLNFPNREVTQKKLNPQNVAGHNVLPQVGRDTVNWGNWTNGKLKWTC